MKNSLFLVSVVADRYQKSILKNKKNPQMDPSLPGPDLGVEEGGGNRPRREGGGAVDCRCRSRSATGPNLSLPPPDPDWSLASVGVGVLAAVVEGAAPCLSTAIAA
jgi:hypothetical protein